MGAGPSGLNTLNTRGQAYQKGPAGGKKGGRGKRSDHRLNADQQREAAQHGLGEAAAVAERAAVVVGDPNTTCRELEQSLEELRGHRQYLTHLQVGEIEVTEREQLQQELERRKVELNVSIQILETRRKRGFPPIAGGGGRMVTGAATNGSGPELMASRLRVLSESAADSGGGFGNRGSNGASPSTGGGGGGSSLLRPGPSGGTEGRSAGSPTWGTGRNPYLVSNSAQSEEYWLSFPFPWNVVPVRNTDLKPGDVMKITAAALPKFGGAAEDYIPWRSAFLPCVHITPLDLSLKVMLLMGTLEARTVRMREIKGSFVGNEVDYRNVISLLEDTFGGEHNLLVARQQSLLAVPQLREGNYDGLELLHIRLGTFLMEWGNTVGHRSEVDSLAFFHILMRKLSPAYARKFEDWLRGRPELVRGLKALHEWVGEQLADHRQVASYGHSQQQQFPVGNDYRHQPDMGGGNYQGRQMGRGARPARGGGAGGHPGGSFPWGGRPPAQQHLYGDDEEGEGWYEVEEDFGGEEEDGEQHYFGQGGKPPAQKPVCGYCTEEHLLGRCPKFRELPAQGKRDWLASQGRCYSCFQKGHNLRTCPRPYKCKKCGDGHNTALHGTRRSTPAGGAPAGGEPHLFQGEGDPEGAQEMDDYVFHMQGSRRGGKVSLRTIGVWLGNPRSGKEEYVNALLDDGSTGSMLLSEELATALGLTGHVARVAVEGVGGKVTSRNSLLTTVRVRSRDGRTTRVLPAQVMGKPAGTYRPVDWNKEKQHYPHLQGVDFPPVSTQWPGVHLLLGSRNSYLHQALEEKSAGEKLPVGRKTPLGWTAAGQLNSGLVPALDWHKATALAQAQDVGYYCWGEIGGERETHLFQRSERKDQSLVRLVEKMWEVEDLAEQEVLSPAEQYVLDLMRTKTSRKGRQYVLPCTWKPANTRPPMGYERALQRLESLERSKVFRLPGVKDKYQDVIREWETEEVTKRVQQGPEAAHFLAHFPVYNPHKLSSKVRPVMDCSTALNDHLLAGPKLINEVVEVLLRFRSGLVGYSGDVAKMFLRICLREEDKPYHCFLWRESPQKELIIYQFQSHVFGNKGSPFVALYALREQAKIWRGREPRGAETLANSTLVDDVLDSADSAEEARRDLATVRVILADMGMEVKKCMASDPVVLQDLPEGSRAEEMLDVAAICQDQTGQTELKALGVRYHAGPDHFTFEMGGVREDYWTKRKILKVFPRLFDPLGFLLPYVMTARGIFSAVARRVPGWDEKLAPTKLKRWNQWVQQLEGLPQIKIPRCVKSAADLDRAELHVFVDASGEAYAAAAYLKTVGAAGRVTVRLVMARGKVAPATAQSIPRLELLGARLGVQLGETVTKALKTKLEATYYWTDSLNVLFWLRNEHKRLQTFVDNKVRQIRARTELQQWRWVPTKENPADIPTRGADPRSLAGRRLWWEGPDFLMTEEDGWPRAPRLQPTEEGLKELKKIEQVFVQFNRADIEGEQEIFPYTRVGTWRKAVRVARLLLSWRARVRKEKVTEQQGEELLLRQMQLEHRKIMATPTEENLRKAGLHKLGPFVDEAGVVRGRGRLLQVAALPRDVREPIFLPKNHPGTQLLLRHLHVHDARHVGGVNHTLARLHERFWLPKPRQQVYRVLQECIPCRRRLARVVRPEPGPLPEFRVPLPGEEPVAFVHTGMDCAGPFRVRRGRSEELHYLLLLTCCKTRAVKLELLTSLSVDSLLLALSRVAERGVRPKMFLSDNGGNFQAANLLQGEIWRLLQEGQEAREQAFPQVEWKFNPPYASHWGGVFERLVGSAKRALMHALPVARLFNMEQLQTAFALAEGALNARPLAYVSGGAEELAPLTPNHFLYGSASRPLYVVPNCPNRAMARRWLLVQEAAGVFWERLQKEIRPFLQISHRRGGSGGRNLQVGDVVTFLHPTDRGRWPLGRISQVWPGKDGQVRYIEVALPQWTEEQPYQRLPDKLFKRDVGAVALLLPAEQTPEPSC